MKHAGGFGLSLPLYFGLTCIAAAQGQLAQPAQFLQVITTTARSTAVSDYEDYVKKIVAGANKIGAPQRWTVYGVSTGGPGFTYNVALPFNNWSEVDEWTAVSQILSKAYGEAEASRITRAGRASIERTETAVYRLLPDLSTRPKVFDPPTAFIQVFVTDVQPEMVPSWELFLTRLKSAQEKAPQAPTSIRRVAVLGASNRYVTALPFNKYADRDSWPSTPDVLRQAYGETEARSLDETRLRSTREARIMVLAYRPDLSRPATGPLPASR
ncbi:MAG: hypothetical protein ACREMM_04935 [Gemmatimonadales bacterium]